jgi:citrate lyase subunit beta/citryl-CoA lyase
VSLLRSLLFVPGNKANMLDKALGFTPDAFIPDMEDSVPAAEKRNAREVIKSYLPKLAASGISVIPRVNSLDTEWVEEDLAAVVGPHVYGISIGKVDLPDDIATISDMVTDLERKAGIEAGTLKLIPWLESAKAIVHCYPICSSSPRIVGVAFGGEDFTHDLGIERLEDESEVAYPRNVLCIAARAAGIAALDTPYFRLKDEDGLKANIAASKQTGFKGKFAIHPAQIDAINAGFSPSEAEIAHARRIVAAFAQAERQGRGSTSLDGKVIDIPVVKRARGVLAAAGID